MSRRGAWIAVAAACALLLALLWWWSGPGPGPTPGPGAEDPGSPLRQPDPAVTQGDEAPPPSPRATPGDAASRSAGGCAPRAARACHEGDLWWVDGCGALEGPAQECGAQLCRDGACEEPDPDGCGVETERGRCDGAWLRACFAGRVVAVDCAAREARCVIDEEGATCRPLREIECEDEGAEPICEGSALVSCQGGRLWRVDCAAQGASCDARPDGEGFGCVQVVGEGALAEVGRREAEVCGPCGCEGGLPEPEREERCDGLDNDLDGEIDEGAVCAPVPLRVFVVTDAQGRGSSASADIEAEVARLNALFADEEGGLGISFVLQEVIALRRPAWRALEDGALQAVMQDEALRAPTEAFSIPLLLTDELFHGGAPVAGLSTLPNGRCGGARRHAGAQSPLGVIALSKGRSPTTAAHELGHFLGLCHTHESRPGVVQRVAEQGSRLLACDGCLLDGDGLCDTPPDPGPPRCAVTLPACEVTCAREEARPDALNLMSYYTPCRRLFTRAQRLELRRTLALRRAWHPCLQGEGCACGPEAPCPAQMDCKPGVSSLGWSCQLVGGVSAGQRCGGAGDCAAGAVCLRAAGGAEPRCVRLCDEALSACDCAGAAGLGFSVCREDFR